MDESVGEAADAEPADSVRQADELISRLDKRMEALEESRMTILSF